jgi:hypothetical protein
MSQVDQVTQRNASAAEELASTAEEMAAQAEGLQQLVSHFRLAGHDSGPRPSLPPPPAVTHAAPVRTTARAGARPRSALSPCPPRVTTTVTSRRSKETTMATQSTLSEQSQYLGFHIGGEEYAIGILRVREILEYDTVTKVPTTPPSIRGVINLRGSVVPVVDPRGQARTARERGDQAELRGGGGDGLRGRADGDGASPRGTAVSHVLDLTLRAEIESRRRPFRDGGYRVP